MELIWKMKNGGKMNKQLIKFFFRVYTFFADRKDIREWKMKKIEELFE